MWIFFGLITLVVFSISYSLKRRETRWKGEFKSGGYEYLIKKHKGRITGVWVGIEIRNDIEFAFKKEGCTEIP